MVNRMFSATRVQTQTEELIEQLEKMPVIVRLSQIHKHYKGTTAVEHVNLDIRQGEFFTFLGPSGSGKTTTLRMIAGFEKPDGGHIEINGSDVTLLPPFERDVNTVFQDYALFPHMSVRQNVGYGLEARRVTRRDISMRVEEALRMVRLDSFADRMPSQLSGGQRQRVALARAIVNHPRVLLLDEPLGALDLKLRQQMQIELKSIQKATDITFIYVTHDQEEALFMSDRIAVFSNGTIVQTGTPVEVYERPATEFVANFLGASNILRRYGKKWVIRPEQIRISPTKPSLDIQLHHTESGILGGIEFIGMFTRYVVTLSDGAALLVHEQNLEGFTVREHVRREEPVWVSWSLGSTYELPD